MNYNKHNNNSAAAEVFFWGGVMAPVKASIKFHIASEMSYIP